MSWIQKLYETYDKCKDAPQFENNPLPPIGHIAQQAHIEIVVDADGNFRRASVVNKEITVIPATEKSSTARTSAIVPHPLCDHVKYCAGDYVEDNQIENEYFEKYREQLGNWCQLHPKATAVFKYIEKKTVLSDLIKEGVMPVDADGHLLRAWESTQNKPPLLKQLTAEKKIYKPQNALIRWRVETANDPVPEVWKDKNLQDAWLAYCTENEATKTPDLCMVTGSRMFLADKHQNKIRNGKDGAKLISNKKDTDSDFVYLGRFLSARQAAGVGTEVSEKAHNALRWLVQRQAFRNGDQAIIAWDVGGKEIPDPFGNTADTFELDVEGDDSKPQFQGDIGQAFALRLNNRIRGYRAKLGSTDGIVVMGLDSATPGRMAITYYRELTGSEYLDRIQAWHTAFAWHQDYGRDAETKQQIRFVGAPSPKDIAEAAYGRPKDKQHEKLIKVTVERLLPCIIDGQAFPGDLRETTFRKTCNRISFEKDKYGREWDWEKNLGIACALIKGAYIGKERYQMTLETNRVSRDYLYGRLLAIADSIEGFALTKAEKNRDTTAAKLMQRFSSHPFSTWKNIELALKPYMSRLRTSDHGVGFLVIREKLLDEVVCAFQGDDFTDDRPLSGEFLLGYHCQRRELNKAKPHKDGESATDAEMTSTDN
ncbi:type I-C CRISPR-associated protein Cas8c/Csd1 [Nitrosomonas sp. sh817]|uniref:type I-C CRISPR-associated protein Cas8c/Csd1 n=1 Tax=Nitrosomonas sp. sh817 TaxID=3070658 RepID=UPI0027DD88BD|nr:type I-C CRISPR-associated protein Cas8c/Csd1 [Nitrosomonas sp. sh817]WMJ09093.1 type I-C CRISPR-associated protein Cas8c/Csd1 [Nitrosomonas sp. sh817]